MAEIFLHRRLIGEFEGVLFDKDGTLSYSEPYLEELANLRIQEAILLFKKERKSSDQISQLKQFLIRTYGLTPKGIDPGGILAIGSKTNNLLSTATIFCLLGESWPKAISYASKVFDSASELERDLSHKIKKRTILPGAKNFLKSLNYSGLKCALISNDCSSGIKEFLIENNLENVIELFWSAEHIPNKPNPLAVKKVCASLELDPSRCALIGDADSDLKMAREANVGAALGFTSGWRISPKLTEHQFLINHWNDLTVKETPTVPQ